MFREIDGSAGRNSTCNQCREDIVVGRLKFLTLLPKNWLSAESKQAMMSTENLAINTFYSCAIATQKKNA